jgi:uncharacterized protein (TIGR04255 family)
MLFPESDRVVFGINPLVEVICQFKFPPILRIASDLPTSYQEHLRSAFPFFRTKNVPNINMMFMGVEGLLPSLAPGHNVVHEFISEDNSWIVSLTQEYVALTTRHYQNWGEFSSRMISALDALEEVYNPGFFSRIGLRYQDVIRRSQIGIETAPWSKLLKPELLGLLSNMDMEENIEETNSQLLLSLGDNKGKVRLNHGFALVQGTPEICYVIDSDFFTENRTGVDDGLAILTTFNAEAGNLFRWCITNELRDALQPQPIA